MFNPPAASRGWLFPETHMPELHLVENRIGIGQLRLIEDDRELMRSEPMDIEAARRFAIYLGDKLGLVAVQSWEGPKK